MVKLLENFCDKFTMKSLDFIIDQKNSDEVINMIYHSVENTSILKPKKYNRELIITVSEYEEEKILMYKIKVELSDKEWYNLLKQCKEQDYQLIIKRNHDEMYFSKLESK